MGYKIIDIEISKGLERIWGMERYNGFCALVRCRTQPIGWIWANAFNQPALSAEYLAEAIKTQIGWQFLPILLSGRTNPIVIDDPALPPISVVVCATNRTSQLEACLAALLRLDYPKYEIVLIDNGQSIRRTDLVAHHRVRYVREEQPGMARARNRGLAESNYEIIAFTDGDARPDTCWLRKIGMAFLEPDVMAVSGFIAPGELETASQFQFHYGGYGMEREFQPRRLKRNTISDDELVWVNRLGTGTNMAFRRQIFRSLGSFNEAFRGGTSCDGSDLEMFHRLLAADQVMMYQPAAIVWLTSPRDPYSLRQLVHEQSRGFGTYLVSRAFDRSVGRRLTRPLLCDWLWRRLIYRAIKPGKATRRLVLTELHASLASLFDLNTLKAAGRPVAAVSSQASLPAIYPNGVHGREYNTLRHHKESKDEIAVRVIRTWYPHWGQYSGINQFLKHIDKDRFYIETELVQENDNDFPIRSETLRTCLRYMGRRQDMAWYNLSDFAAEMRALRCYWPKKVGIIHYLDGEHSAQFLPRLNRVPPKLRPRLIVSFHQPPEVLAEVIRKDNIRRYDSIIVVAPEQEEFFTAHTKRESVRLILHGIDTDYFRPAVRTADHETITCVTVGHNYRDYKTVHTVAWKLKNDKRIRFHVVSPRPTGLEGLPNVKIDTNIDDDALLNLYQQADVLFLPLIKATANNSLVEGMACGLPVLTTSLPSIKAYAPGNETIQVQNNSADEFVDAILHLVKNPQLRVRMGLKARKRAEELDWRNITPQYEAIYSELASDS